MQLIINGKTKKINSQVTFLADLLNQYSLISKNIIVEYNGEIIKEENFSLLTLKQNDAINIFSFVGGG
ncbi:sulfur carrier protein ThiS [Candidatus Dependentiae bacterium]|nr:sulfur carrier protein ThiS [Candidatus Dependentiae bacterium]